MVGLAGTVSALMLNLGLETHDWNRVHHFPPDS